MKSTEDCSERIERLQREIDTADAIVIGAGAGLSAAAGMDYGGERFEKNFSDFHKKYGITDMYSGGFYPFESLEEHWAWWSRHIMLNRYEAGVGKPYLGLLELIKDRNYFVLTTNVDHQFQLAGFDKQRLFYTQGDYGLWQCSEPCHRKTYDNENQVRQMAAEQRDMKIPTELIPRCPVCKKPMTMNLRSDNTFVEDDGWQAAAERYSRFIGASADKRLLFLELGVGYNTPTIIKFSFQRMTYGFKNAVYACINRDEIYIPDEIRDKSIAIREDIGAVLQALADVR